MRNSSSAARAGRCPRARIVSGACRARARLRAAVIRCRRRRACDRDRRGRAHGPWSSGTSAQADRVGLAIGHHRHHRRCGEHRLGRLRGFDPVPRTSSRREVRWLVCAACCSCPPSPVRAASTTCRKPGRVPRRCGIDGNHRMKKNAASDALADRAQAATCGLRWFESRVRWCPGWPRRAGRPPPAPSPRPSRRRSLRPSPDRYAAIAQSGSRPLPALRRPAQADRARLHDAIEQHRPPLSRRASPKRPRLRSISHPPRPATGQACQACRNNNHKTAPCEKPPERWRPNVRNRFCTLPSAKAGGQGKLLRRCQPSIPAFAGMTERGDNWLKLATHYRSGS